MKSPRGRGTFGDVYQMPFRGRVAAAKFIHASHSEHAQRERMLRKEARVMHSAKEHQNIISILAVCLERNNLCVVMELAERGTLRTLLDERGPDLAMETKFKLTLGIMDGMRTLHSMGILHHDLKPSDVLITAEYVTKLADFGLSSDKNQMTTSLSMYRYMLY